MCECIYINIGQDTESGAGGCGVESEVGGGLKGKR